MLNAIGFSGRQLTGVTVAGQGVLAGLGAVVGVPLGIGFFRLAYSLANGSSAGLVDAPVLHLAAVVAGWSPAWWRPCRRRRCDGYRWPPPWLLSDGFNPDRGY